MKTKLDRVFKYIGILAMIAVLIGGVYAVIRYVNKADDNKAFSDQMAAYYKDFNYQKIRKTVASADMNKNVKKRIDDFTKAYTSGANDTFQRLEEGSDVYKKKCDECDFSKTFHSTIEYGTGNPVAFITYNALTVATLEFSKDDGALEKFTAVSIFDNADEPAIMQVYLDYALQKPLVILLNDDIDEENLQAFIKKWFQGEFERNGYVYKFKISLQDHENQYTAEKRK